MAALLLFFALQAQSATVMSPMELLSMPESNRIRIAKNQPASLYQELLKLANSEDRSVQTRWKALTTAVQINPKGSQNDVHKALQHKAWFMRAAALMSLKAVDTDLADKTAIEMFSDRALMVRSAAVGAISENPTAEVRSALWAELRADRNFRKGQSLWVREEILRKLAVNPEKQEYRSFSNILMDRDQTLSGPAISALEKITHKKLGRTKTTEQEKKNLWVKYAQEHTSIQ
jgi:HEAT repeat protein